MNVQKGQIQALIAEIDDVLSQPNLRLPWVVFGENVTRSRQVLERVRKYLVFLDQQVDEEAASVALETNQPSISPGMREPLWQAIRREMIYLRSHLTQPLQDEVDRLRTEQRNLVQEIQQLEARKAQALAQIGPQSYQQQVSREFLQEFMTRLQDSLIHNVTDTLNHIETRFLDSVLLTEADSLPVLAPEPVDRPVSSLSSLTPAQRLEQMRQLQAQSDHLLMTLDSSLSVIFEALQRNLQTYSDSLSQSLERMHSLGKQGEVMFTTLVNQLAQQVGQETSSYLQSSLQLTESETPSDPTDSPLPPPQPPETPRPQGAVISPLEDLSSAFEEILPYAGAEVPRQKTTGVTPLDQNLDHEELPEITHELEFNLDKVDRSDGLDITPEPSLSFDWDESILEQSPPNADAELESLFDLKTEAKTREKTVVEPGNIDLFGNDFAFVEELDENDVADDIETLLLDEENDVEISAPVEDESEIRLDTQDLFGDVETTKSEDMIVQESPNETDDFLSLNSSDIFGQPDQDIDLESDLSLTADGVNSVSLESEDFFAPEVELVSPLTDEIKHNSTSNLFDETLEDLSDVFEEPTFEDVSPQTNGIVSARTQEMLTGIVSPVASPPRQNENKTVSLDNDIYIQASPSENLLPPDLDEDSEQVDSRLLIDRNTLEYLESDLFNLEQSETIPSPPRSPEKSTNTQPKPPAQKSQSKAVSKVSQPEEMITFEDLFRDIGMEPSSAKSVPSISFESQSSPRVRGFSGGLGEQTQNLASDQGFSNLTLDDVFNSLNLSDEQTLNWDTEPKEDLLSLEALGQEFSQNR